MQTASVELWQEMESALRSKAYRAIESDPQVLLETDGGPVGMQAEIVFARLIGFEDEVVEDGLRLREVVSDLRMPIFSRQTFAQEDCFAVEPIRSALYVLQSGYALTHVAAEYAPPGTPLGPDFTFRVLYVRYRRRA